MCVKTSVYKTQDEAIRKVLRATKAFGKPMRIYFCKEHQCYHGTSKIKGKSAIQKGTNGRH